MYVTTAHVKPLPQCDEKAPPVGEIFGVTRPNVSARLAVEARLAAADASLAAEQAKTEKAIAAFASLAERLDALAAERAKPWWRRLVG
jgi:hypothetical protein